MVKLGRVLNSINHGRIRPSDLTVSSETSTQTTGDSFRDTRFTLDAQTRLAAYRLIGGFDGIQRDEFRAAIRKVRNDTVRIPLEKNLDGLFSEHDKDKDGSLNLIEFERLLYGSTIAQKAVYSLMERLQEEGDEFITDASEDPYTNHFTINKYMDVFAVCLCLVSFAITILQIDHSPTWQGWKFVRCALVPVLTSELALRYALRGGIDGRTRCHLGCLASSTFVIDTPIVILGWLDVCYVLLDTSNQSSHHNIIASLWWGGILQGVRCFARLRRLLWYHHELREFLSGLITGLRAAAWGLAMIIMIVFLWSMFIRTFVAHDWLDHHGNELADIFTNIPSSMFVVFRCMAINSDGSCAHGKPAGFIFRLLSEEFGWPFKLTWVVTEAFIMIGILNVVTSMFFLQAAENRAKIYHSINVANHDKDKERLNKLDKLLRVLIHPQREQSNPKDRNAAAVAKLIRTSHPEAAAQIPNLETQIVHFARTIQDAKSLHQRAMNIYEAEEANECKQLARLPSAKTYVIDGFEQLLVDDEIYGLENALMLPMAPMGAVPVTLVQEWDTCEMLLEQAAEVQKIIKNILLPNSEWAETVRAWDSGPIWKQSKGLCDEAIDPGLKSLERIHKKVSVKYAGRYECNRDYARLALIYESVAHLIQALPRFLEFRLDADYIQVVSVENRFMHPHPLGWRDVTLLLKVKLRSGHHIMELQLRLKMLANVCHEGHKFYEEIRANLPDALMTTILDRLVTDTTLDLGITKTEWLQCLPNGEVRKLLDALGIPSSCRRNLFDVIDVDGSGTITSSELQETLKHFKRPLDASELTGCHSRVRDVQRHLQMNLEPQLGMLRADLRQSLSLTGSVFQALWTRLAFDVDEQPPMSQCNSQSGCLSPRGGFSPMEWTHQHRKCPGSVRHSMDLSFGKLGPLTPVGDAHPRSSSALSTASRGSNQSVQSLRMPLPIQPGIRRPSVDGIRRSLVDGIRRPSLDASTYDHGVYSLEQPISASEFLLTRSSRCILVL